MTMFGCKSVEQMCAEIMALPGVTACRIMEPDFLTYEFAVSGGDDVQIAQVIVSGIPVVGKTLGDVSVDLAGEGISKVIRFSRRTTQP